MTPRLNSQDAERLRWFWLVAPGEMGLRAVNVDGGGGGNGDTDPRAIQASEKWRRINRALDAIPKASVRVLQRVYATEATWAGLSAFGPLACLVVRSGRAKALYRATVGSKAAYRDGFEKWLRALSARILGPAKKLQAGDAETVAQICFDCDAMLSRACKQYVTASNELKRVTEIERKGRLAATERARAAWKTRKASLDAGGHDGDG
jgi:hypothetical protein